MLPGADASLSFLGHPVDDEATREMQRSLRTTDGRWRPSEGLHPHIMAMLRSSLAEAWILFSTAWRAAVQIGTQGSGKGVALSRYVHSCRVGVGSPRRDTTWSEDSAFKDTPTEAIPVSDSLPLKYLRLPCVDCSLRAGNCYKMSR